MWKSWVPCHGAGNLNAVNAAFWHLCIWLRAADNARLATIRACVYIEAFQSLEIDCNGQLGHRCKANDQIPLKGEIWFIPTFWSTWLIALNVSQNSFGFTSHVHLVRSPQRSDWSVLPSQCQRRKDFSSVRKGAMFKQPIFYFFFQILHWTPIVLLCNISKENFVSSSSALVCCN